HRLRRGAAPGGAVESAPGRSAGGRARADRGRARRRRDAGRTVAAAGVVRRHPETGRQGAVLFETGGTRAVPLRGAEGVAARGRPALERRAVASGPCPATVDEPGA